MSISMSTFHHFQDLNEADHSFGSENLFKRYKMKLHQI
jgi:hypothetical protein